MPKTQSLEWPTHPGPPRTSRDDEQLMEQVQAGSVDAFAELYTRYCGQAYQLSRWVCRDDGRAEDAVQEGFVAVWRNRASYLAQRGTVAAWILTIVRHRAIDVGRRDDRHTSRRATVDWVDERPAPDDTAAAVADRAEAEQIQALLARLPDAQREVIALAFYAQLTHTEIAARLGVPSGTVKGRMRLGLHRLRADLA